jgi:hypothetical protein
MLTSNDSVMPIFLQRYRICHVHMNAMEVKLNGRNMRFCQQCGRLHGIEEFEGKQKSCTERLRQHASRRRHARANKRPLTSGGGTKSGRTLSLLLHASNFPLFQQPSVLQQSIAPEIAARATALYLARVAASAEKFQMNATQRVDQPQWCGVLGAGHSGELSSEDHPSTQAWPDWAHCAEQHGALGLSRNNVVVPIPTYPSADSIDKLIVQLTGTKTPAR